MSLDPRFLTIHPATTLWWKQREKCRQCANVIIKHEAPSRAAGNTILRCKLAPSANHFAGYCIDMRSPGQQCSPDAALFKKGKTK